MSMNPRREEALFAAALEQAPADRAAFLKGACLGDAALRARVEALLASHEATANPLHTAATMKVELEEDPPDEAVGQTLGRYKLLEKLGEGGCGVVYVAEQSEPVRRRVALKVIKLGMDTKQVVARFEAERQALAMMDHPNIAKVLDAGTTDQGRPYFVMELVRGVAITRYCDESRLATRNRLDLFIKVCQAIQHAHQKGIVHRDIKPSNILVTLHDGVPVPKVIDFGIAKAMEGRLTDSTVYTQLHQFIGTPAYMSPEQAEMSGLDIDTRSDIYSLGVLLYEMLTGRTPFDPKELMAQGIDAMRKTIREQEPARPSVRLATLAGEELTTTALRHSVDTAKLSTQLKGDLDWIVMKCIEKDRSRRYETANGVAADIQRHLGNEPVTARPPSTAYRLQKTFRRNQVVFAAAAAVTAALLLGMVVSAWQAVRATQATKAETAQRLLAEAARAEAQTKQREAEAERSRADAQARQALESHERSRRLLYAADISLAQQALKQNNLGRARELLDRHRPTPGEQDLRGWEWRHSWQQSQGDSHVVLAKPSTNQCSSLSFSADGARLAVGYLDGRVELWDATHRVLLKELSPKTGAPGRVAFSPRSNLLASTTGNGALSMLNLSSGRETQVWERVSVVRSVAFTRDGSRLIAYVLPPGGLEAAVTIDLEHGLVMSTNVASGGDAAFLGIARLSSDKRRLFTSRGNRQSVQAGVRCLDPETGREIWDADVASDAGISAMALSPDDKVLVTGTGYADGTIRVWDAETGRPLTQLEGPPSWTKDVTFSHDGRWLASANDQTVRLWETSGWTQARVLNGHGESVRNVAFSPDDRILASGGKDGAILLWNLAATNSGRSHQRLPPEINLGPEIAPGILVGDHLQDQKPILLRLDDLSTTPLGIDIKTNHAGQSLPPNLVAIHDQTNSLKIFEFRDSTLKPLTELQVGTNAVSVRGDSNSDLALAHHPAQRLLAWGEATNEVHIAALDEPGRHTQWASGFSRPVPLEFSPDGKLLALGQPIPGRGVEVREVTTGRLIVQRDFGQQPRGVFYTGRLTEAKFVDGGRRLVVASTGEEGVTVLFWDLTQPEKDPVRFSEPGAFRSLGVSPDGRWFALGSNSGSVALYNAATLERSPNLSRGRSAIHALAFSPDGRTLATGSSGLEAVKLWQVETGQELLTFPGDSAPMEHIVFADGGNALLARRGGHPVSWQMWRVPPWDAIHAVEAQASAKTKQP